MDGKNKNKANKPKGSWLREKMKRVLKLENISAIFNGVIAISTLLLSGISLFAYFYTVKPAFELNKVKKEKEALIKEITSLTQSKENIENEKTRFQKEVISLEETKKRLNNINLQLSNENKLLQQKNTAIEKERAQYEEEILNIKIYQRRFAICYMVSEYMRILMELGVCELEGVTEHESPRFTHLQAMELYDNFRTIDLVLYKVLCGELFKPLDQDLVRTINNKVDEFKANNENICKKVVLYEGFRPKSLKDEVPLDEEEFTKVAKAQEELSMAVFVIARELNKQFGTNLIIRKEGWRIFCGTCFKLTNSSFQRLRNEGIPDKVLESLKSLEDMEFKEYELLRAVDEQIGEEQTAKYKKLFLKHAICE